MVKVLFLISIRKANQQQFALTSNREEHIHSLALELDYFSHVCLIVVQRHLDNLHIPQNLMVIGPLY